MAIDRDTIERRYRSDLEAAEAWKDANPERYADELNKATSRRGDAYADLAAAAETTARTATIASARAQAIQQFPLADPDSIAGDTPEAIAASAKRSHDFVAKAQEDARKAALAERRPQTRAAWMGGAQGSRPGLPGGEIRGDEGSPAQKQAEATWDRTAEVIRESRQPGTLRRYSDDALSVLRSQDPEAQAFADYRLLHPNSGLSDAALRARAEGTATFAPNQSGVPESEERKG